MVAQNQGSLLRLVESTEYGRLDIHMDPQ
jgi:hypothetical protein